MKTVVPAALLARLLVHHPAARAGCVAAQVLPIAAPKPATGPDISARNARRLAKKRKPA